MKQLFILFAATALFTACKQQAKKANGSDEEMKELVKKYKGLNAGTGSFTIDAISGWTKQDTAVNGLQTVFIASEAEGADDTFLENINVVTEAAKGYSTEKYFEANLKAMSTQMPGFEKINSGETVINGLPAKTLLYSHSYTGQPVDAGCYFFVKNDIGYVITCTTLKGGYNKWKPRFDSIVNTFSVK